ncbi:Rhomboid protease GluP [Phycisphaerales bacterium]|nr:Rhomboid protease GluP [Phycisphaerales bacterium]
MGIYDRDYIWGSKKNMRPRVWSFNTWLIIINVAVYLLQLTTANPSTGSTGVEAYGYFSTHKVATLSGGLEFWRVLTFQFLHGGVTHLFFNMLGLYMFGPMVEQHLGSKRYLAFYLTCGIFGGLAYLLLNAGGAIAEKLGYLGLPGLLYNYSDTHLIGASAGVFGVILACAYIAPNLTVQLIFPPIPLRMRTMAYVYVLIAAGSVIFGSDNAGGEAAHLGGAAAGYVLIRRAYLLRDFFDVFSDSRLPSKSRPPGPAGKGPKLKLHVEPPSDAEIDRILDKVKAQGRASLTKSETDTLARWTDAKNAEDAARGKSRSRGAGGA